MLELELEVVDLRHADLQFGEGGFGEQHKCDACESRSQHAGYFATMSTAR